MKYVILYLYNKIILKTIKICRFNNTKLKTQLIRINREYNLDCDGDN
jgi:hypothetical protein